MNKKVSKFVNSTYNYINNIINKIQQQGIFQNINEILTYINKLPNNDKDSIYEELINKYLLGIKALNITSLENIDKNIDDTLSFFYHDNEIYIFIGNKIANTIVNKINYTYNETSELPIKLEYIKKYCIDSDIKNVDLVLVWIIIKLACINNCLKIN